MEILKQKFELVRCKSYIEVTKGALICLKEAFRAPATHSGDQLVGRWLVGWSTLLPLSRGQLQPSVMVSLTGWSPPTVGPLSVGTTISQLPKSPPTALAEEMLTQVQAEQET